MPGTRRSSSLARSCLLVLIGQLGLFASLQAADDPQFPATMVAEYHVPVPMRDGVRLATDVYRPAAEGRFPTLFVRDIYTNGSTPARQRLARWATDAGYVFVLQQARGRYDSEGQWYPYFQEIEDGDDALNWIAEQAWSNGRVGMFGTSYLASVQWLAALNRNPALQAIAPAMSPGNYYRDVAYPGGAFSLLSRASWGIGTVGSRTNQQYPIDWIDGIGRLPIAELDTSLGFDVQHFRDWVAHPSYDDYWRPLNLEARAPEMEVPALNIGGWYDVFLRSTIGSFTTMQAEAATQRARGGQRLVIGPWVHGWNQRIVGQEDFGPDAIIDAEALQREWFDHWLKDMPEPSGAPVRIFVMGANEWREEQAWPLARTEYTPMYLGADGSLSAAADADAGALGYRYDPADPVPTVGGNIMRPELRGPYDQRPLDDRDDVLRFVTEPFETATEITGPVRAVLYAETDAADTDFMVKLSVVKTDGRVINLVDGVIRTRFAQGFEREVPIAPNAVQRYDIDVWATSYRLAPGERLRVDVSSSNYPRLARNPNTGAPFAQTTDFVVANQRIHVGGAHASHVVLPVIPAP